ncbi:hypothetical protein [Deinococcus aquaedulcis]|uniref:hypothetical protein n=1 Tax=Deinococcus aquaedulcis TaxID=2840455 RepID=UPI001C83DFEA|nr:hypothetical protein [Deinococcus aquaedulcis]
MKKILIFSTLLLAGCAATQPQPPFKVGEAIQLAGTTKEGAKVQQRYVLNRPGTFADGLWRYRVLNLAGTFGVGEVWVDDTDIVVIEYTDLGAANTEPTKTLCIAFPQDTNWRSVDGALIHGALDKMNKLNEQLEALNDEAAVGRLFSDAGTCTLTRQ